MKPFLAAAGLAVLTACGTPTARLDMTPLQSELRLRALVSSVMLREVSLPTYAAVEDIAFEAEPGIIATNEGFLWADDPSRAVTLAMTRHMDRILNATVGPDPWPLGGLPDVAIEVRVSEMLAGADGVFRFAGQYYVGGDGIDFPNSSAAFDIGVPIVGEGPQALALAQSTAILQLSETLARKLAR